MGEPGSSLQGPARLNAIVLRANRPAACRAKDARTGPRAPDGSTCSTVRTVQVPLLVPTYEYHSNMLLRHAQ